MFSLFSMLITSLRLHHGNQACVHKNGWANNTHSGNITFYLTSLYLWLSAEINASQHDRYLYRNIGGFIIKWYDTTNEGKTGQLSLTQPNSKINHKSLIFICKLKQQSSLKPSSLGRMMISQYLMNILLKLLFFQDNKITPLVLHTTKLE